MRLYFIAGLLLWFATAPAQDCSITLKGHVEDRDTRDQLSSASVILQPGDHAVITDTAGNFVLPGLCPGVYRLSVTHQQCADYVRSLKLNTSQHLDLSLPHAANTLGMVTVEASKGVANTGFRKELSGEALLRTRGQSIAESLSALNGVTLLQTGSTISKPVIHGLHSNRVLMINNGVRQEAQQWGNEHAPEIDPFIADKLVVIKGVDELRYGSDAIGGVILVEPKVLRYLPGQSAEFNTGYSTNSRQYYASAQWEQQLKKIPAFTYRLQGTFKKAANTSTPDYRLNNTAHHEYDGSVALRYKKKGWQTELFYSLFSAELGIFTGSHIGNVTDLMNAINGDRPASVFTGQQTYQVERPRQQVTHQLLKSKTIVQAGAGSFQLQIAAQQNHREEYDIVRSASNTRPQLDLNIRTLTEDLHWDHPRFAGLQGAVGVSLMQQDNRYHGRYFIPNYDALQGGVYWLEKWTHHQWEVQGGIRADRRTIDTRRLKVNNDTINHEFSFNTFAASLHGIWKPTVNWRFQAGISASSRAPYVNELLSDGIHHGTATYEKGDIFLQPEKSIHSSVSVQFQQGPLTLELLAYNNRINDFIYQVPKPDSPVLTIAGAFPLLQYEQTDAVLNGIDIQFGYQLSKAVMLSGKTALLYARNRNTSDWLIGMPSNRYTATVQVQVPVYTKPTVSVSWTQVDRQRRFPNQSNGKVDYKEPPAAYGLLQADIAVPVTLGKHTLDVGITGYNLLNTRYRDYLNSMRYFTDEAGRNISFRLRLPLTFNNKPS